MELNVEQMLAESLPSMIEGFKAEIKAQISWDVKDKTSSMVSAHVEAWVKEHLLPEITAALVESKDGLVSIGVSLAPEVASALTSSLLAELKEKLEQSWTRGKIFEAMFK